MKNMPAILYFEMLGQGFSTILAVALKLTIF